jgi:hypothetical protein
MDSSNDLGSVAIYLPCLVDGKGMAWLSIMIMAIFNDLDIPKAMVAGNMGIGT